METRLLQQLQQMYEEADYIEDEMKDMTAEEFKDFEVEQYTVDEFDGSFEEYLQWAIDNFGVWGCPPQ